MEVSLAALSPARQAALRPAAAHTWLYAGLPTALGAAFLLKGASDLGLSEIHSVPGILRQTFVAIARIGGGSRLQWKACGSPSGKTVW